MKSALFSNLRQTMFRFFEPLTKHTFWTVSASIIIGMALYVGIDIGLAELVRQNSYDVHMLTTELLTEVGPSLIYESAEHAEMIQLYVDHLEERNLAALLRVLYPKYSPEKVLMSKAWALKYANTEEEARNAIWQTGLVSNHLHMRGKRFPRSPVRWFESENVPDWLLMDLEKALDTFHELVDKLEKYPNRESGIEACRADRRAILLLFIARLGYYDEEKIEAFRTDVGRSRDCIRALTKGEKDKGEQEFLYDLADTENRRVKILDAMLVNDMDRVNDILREAIEKAFEREKDYLPE